MEIQLKRFLLAVVVSFSFTGFSQIAFHHAYTGNGYDKGEGLAQLPDSGYLMTGMSSSFADAPAQAFLMNLDKLGNVRWSRSYGGPESEVGRRVFAVPGHGYYIVGTSSSGGTNGFDAWITFTNESGAQQWEVFTDNGAWERIHDAMMLADTSIVAVGETDHTPEGRTDFFMVRYDKTGAIVWKRQLHYSQGDDVLYTVQAISDSTFLVGGTLYRADSMQNKGFVGKFNNDGSLVWQNYYGNNGNYLIRDIELSVTGNIWAIGDGMKPGYNDKDVFSAYISPSGTYYGGEDQHQIADARFTCFTHFTAGNTDNYLVAYQSAGSIYDFVEDEDALLARYDPAMTWTYGMRYSGTRQDQFNQIIPTKDGYAAAVGFHTTFGTGGNSAMLVKLGSDVAFPDGGPPVIMRILEAPEFAELEGVNAYPNPVQNEVTIELIDKTFDWMLTDLSGKVISTGSGFNAQQIDCTQFPSGVYLLKVNAENRSTTFRLLK